MAGTNGWDLIIAVIWAIFFGGILYIYREKVELLIVALSKLIGKTEEAFGIKFNSESYDDLLDILQRAQDEAKKSGSDETLEAINAAIEVVEAEAAEEPPTDTGNKSVHFDLTPQESQVLEALRQSPDGIGKFDDLIKAISKDGNTPTKNHLAVVIVGLRKKGYSIQGKRGLGYRLVLSPK